LAFLVKSFEQSQYPWTMHQNLGDNVFSRLLVWTAGLATVLVLPNTAFDPINVPKLLVIAVGGFMALGALAAERKLFLQSKYRLVQIFGGAFILDLIIVLLVSGTNFNQEFYGTFGRATGFVAYFSLCLLLIAAVIAAQVSSLVKITWTLLVAGGASIIYGGLQASGGDPFNWVSGYNPVIGFLGNPNFQSSFVGFNGIVAFALMIGNGKKLLRILMAADVLASVAVIASTDSQQGFLVLAGGIAVVVLMWIKNSKYKVALIPGLVISFIGAVFVALGSLNSGPLASLLYKASVTYRGDYWRAGWKMTIEHPLFGVGLDSYGDWYRRARSVEATLRRGPDVVSNAAHNVLLDLSSNGGYPLLTIYLFMLGLVLVSAWRVLHRSNIFDPFFSGLFAVWIAYQAQSIISLNQLGLAVWGWIISGLIIGYEINTREEKSDATPKQGFKKGRNIPSSAKTKVSAGVLLGMFVGGLVGLVIGLQPLIASSKFLSALNSKDPKIVQQAAYVSPLDANYMYRVADILANNKLVSEAVAVSNDSLKHFTDDYPLWAFRSRIQGLPQEEIDRALKEMKRLDPNNPNLK
jgi:O-antigen ligase